MQENETKIKQTRRKEEWKKGRRKEKNVMDWGGRKKSCKQKKEKGKIFKRGKKKKENHTQHKPRSAANPAVSMALMQAACTTSHTAARKPDSLLLTVLTCLFCASMNSRSSDVTPCEILHSCISTTSRHRQRTEYSGFHSTGLVWKSAASSRLRRSSFLAETTFLRQTANAFHSRNW